MSALKAIAATFDDLIAAAESACVDIIDPQPRGYRYRDGVLVHHSCYAGDEYLGTSDTLISVNLVERHMLPGEPGRNRNSVSIPGSGGDMRDEGARRIMRRSRDVFSVFVVKARTVDAPPTSTRKNDTTDSAPSNVIPLRAIAGQGTNRTRYHYPKSLLNQSYFFRGGDGTWHEPRFTLRVLGSDNFASPIGALLDQLESEGHDVKGARVEWLAFRDLAKQYSELFFDLTASPRASTVASHLYRCSDGGKS